MDERVSSAMQSVALALTEVTSVSMSYVRMLGGDYPCAILLSQIVYWCYPNRASGSRLRVIKDGEAWLAKSESDWADEICIKHSALTRCLNKLRDLGLIETRLWKFSGAPTNHIRINWKRLGELLAPHLPNPVQTESIRTVRTESSETMVRTESIRTCTDTTSTDTTSTERERETSQPVPAPGGAEPAMEVFRRGLEKDKRLLVRLSEKPEWGGVYDHGGVISALPEYFRHPNHLVKGYLDTQRSMFSVAGEEKIADEQAALKVGGQVAGMINQLRKEGYTCPQIAASMRAWFLWKPPDDWHSALVHHKPPAAWRRWIAEVWGPENPPAMGEAH